MAKSVYTREEREAQFVKTGIELARKVGVSKVTAAAVANKHKITAPLIFHIFGNRDKFHAAVRAGAKKAGITLVDEVAVKPRKRSVAEVKAIKNKVTKNGKPVGKSVAKGSSAGKPVTATKSATGKPSRARSAKTGKIVTAAHAKANPDTTVTEKIKRKSVVAAQKFPTMPAPSADAVGTNLVQKV